MTYYTEILPAIEALATKTGPMTATEYAFFIKYAPDAMLNSFFAM